MKIKYPFFKEHVDTKQLAYYLNEFRPGDICTITLKLHGTSGRTANTIRETKAKRTFVQKILRKKPGTVKNWGVVSGSRRVILRYENSEDGEENFRKRWHNIIAPRLQKGEEIFYEIVGWESQNKLIMPEGKNKKIGDPEFIKQYGETTQFTYGCEPGECDVYVYRMTRTDEDGYAIEYPDWLVRIRCEQMGLKCVPKLDEFIYTTSEDLLQRVDQYIDGADPIGKTHIREGVVVRIQNRESFKALKAKNFNFKVLEDLIKDGSNVPDMEEAQEVDIIDENLETTDSEVV